LGQQEKKLFRQLLEVFVAAAGEVNATYWLYGGTLMGLARNGTILPWDDDFDLAMKEEAHDAVVAHLASHMNATNCTTYLHAGGILKIFSKTDYVKNYRVRK